jgi:hypothetical protein
MKGRLSRGRNIEEGREEISNAQVEQRDGGGQNGVSLFLAPAAGSIARDPPQLEIRWESIRDEIPSGSVPNSLELKTWSNSL